ncbi:MAG TPA: hypothetical protein VEK12_05320 [Alphaproteobacteria bacterium]|nr:hypothetical protein [Alphaproteobacteria bacterium]
MMRRAVWLWLCVVLGLGFGVYELKLQVQGLEQRLAKDSRDILADEEAIHVLKAEWSYLNEPERIDALARKYLDMVPLEGSQYGSFDALAQRGEGADAGPNAAQPASPSLPVPVARPKPPKGNRVTLARETQ